MRLFGTACLATALMAISCGKTGQETQAPTMKKVEAPAAGLPVEAAARTGEAPVNPHGGMPNDSVHRGMGGPMGTPAPGHGAVDESLTDGNPLPLRATGLGGAGELKKAVENVTGDEAKARFDEAFRRTFTVDKSQRDPEKARELFEGLLREQPGLAEAYRGLAYVALSRGFDMAGARGYYAKALEVRPDYGEVHYALAFLYAGDDREKGAEHLKKALELGMIDEQGLKEAYGIE